MGTLAQALSEVHTGFFIILVFSVLALLFVIGTLAGRISVVLILGPPLAGGFGSPKGDPAQQEAAGEKRWDLVEPLRLVCTRPEIWEAPCCAGLDAMLTAAERPALPGERDKVRPLAPEDLRLAARGRLEGRLGTGRGARRASGG